MPTCTRDEFVSEIEAARGAAPQDPRPIVAPLGVRLLGDQLTPVLAYRRLVSQDERTAPSFLLESVEGGERQGRHSILGAGPRLEVVARRTEMTIIDHRARTERRMTEPDPLAAMKRLSTGVRYVKPPAPPGAPEGLLPGCVLGGWFGYAAYDAVRYAEPEKLAWERAPEDDRHLPDLHFGLYDRIVIFDHVDKLVHLVALIEVGADEEPGARYDNARHDLDELAVEVQTHSKPLPSGRVDRDVLHGAEGPAPLASNMTRERHEAMVHRAKEYIRAGDIFQVVLGQRFERTSVADPFDIYRALRAVNPSPYMVYLQARDCILVASSPEILCRVRQDPTSGRFNLTNRPLAGTRRRGATAEEDLALERELLADEKERAEHIMLVDLGRNDVGKVCEPGSIQLPAIMEIERYSHVMHISSTVTGALRPGLDCWDALRATLPVGTISGAPKIRAMQIIDELEPVRRGPYGGGMGYVSLDGETDIALALRTIVAPTSLYDGRHWTYHLQAAGGIVADSQADAEYQETVNKAAALARAIDLAESAFHSE